MDGRPQGDRGRAFPIEAGAMAETLIDADDVRSTRC